MRRLVSLSCLAMALTLAAPHSPAQDSLQNLAQQLVALRGEVDELQTELNIQREEHKNRMAFLSAQRAELETNRDRERLRLRQLENDITQLREQQLAAGADAEQLAPLASQLIEQASAYVAAGFPFKTSERLADLEAIRSQLEAGVIPPQRAINRTWAFLEDEFRLTRENAIYSQTIDLDGQSVLADVAKIGTVMMFFRTRDERYGRLVQQGDSWRWQLLEDPAQVRLVEGLFDSLRKQIRQGYFELPNALASSGAGS